ncbi:hypothetical protein D9M68_866660 [compost metagenome]
MLLSQADLTVSEGETKAAPGPRATKASAPAAKKAASKTSAPAKPDTVAAEALPEQQRPRKLPSVHIDVQVHISPDTSPEQIDRIFASMSKHLGSYIG